MDLFLSFFKDAVCQHIPGRQFDVQIMYTEKPEPDYVDACMLTCLQLHEDEDLEALDDKLGGVLVFLPGQEDIENLQILLEEHLPSSSLYRQSRIASGVNRAAVEQDYIVFPMYAALSPDEQLKAFTPAPNGVRKFILATNIAETSVTISGIKYGTKIFISLLTL